MTFFEDQEWQAVIAFTQGPQRVPEIIPSIRDVTRIVAGLGRFFGRKGDGEPGVKSLWVGLL
jgi:Transposase Tn5 dimerisation domain